MWAAPLVVANQARSLIQAIEPAQPIGLAASAQLAQPPTCDRADVNGDGAINIADVAFVGLHAGESQALDLSTIALIGACYGAPIGSAIPLALQLPDSALLPGSTTHDLPQGSLSVNSHSLQVSVDATVSTIYTVYLPVLQRSAPGMNQVNGHGEWSDALSVVPGMSRDVRALIQWFVVLPLRWMVAP